VIHEFGHCVNSAPFGTKGAASRVSTLLSAHISRNRHIGAERPREGGKRILALCEVPRQIVGAEAMRQRGVAGDFSSANQVGQRLLHRHHALGLAYRDLGA
jgi:hypothetical protein